MRGRRSIIVVEDNRADLNLIKRSVGQSGVDCEISTFADGAEIIAFVNDSASRVADVIVLDLNLPAVEGAAVLNSIRGSPRWSRVPVVIFTSSTAPADIGRIKKLGADAYIVKPSNLDEFVKIGEVIKEFLHTGNSTPCSEGG